MWYISMWYISMWYIKEELAQALNGVEIIWLYKQKKELVLLNYKHSSCFYNQN